MFRNDNTARVQATDVFLTLFVLVGIIVTAPIWYRFIDMVSSEAGSFSGLVLQLIVPILLLSVIVSVGVSARRRRT